MKSNSLIPYVNVGDYPVNRAKARFIIAQENLQDSQLPMELVLKKV